MNTEKIVELATALSHPIRIMILEKLANQSCCYHGDLSEEIPVAKSTLSQHLNVLKSAGLIQGEIKPPKTKYCINSEVWDEAKKNFHWFFSQMEKVNCCE